MFKPLEPSKITDLSADELKRLLKLIINNEVELPLNAVRIACIGFQHRHEALMNSLRNLESNAIRAVLVTVLHERSKNEKQIEKLKRALDRELSRNKHD